jgi:hypothetical protein
MALRRLPESKLLEMTIDELSNFIIFYCGWFSTLVTSGIAIND